MLHNTATSPETPKPDTTINTWNPTTLNQASYQALSVVPINWAIWAHDLLVGSTAEHGVVKQFVTELKSGLLVKGGSSNFVGKLIPKYLVEVYRDRMYTGELVAFGDKLKFDLTQAYDESLPAEIRDQYKQRAFKNLMLRLGPHGQKFIQSMRPKEANSWIANVIAITQSDLPAMPLHQVESLLKDAFRAQGSIDYAEHFSDYFKVVRILGAGTVGISTLVTFKASSTTPEIELVAKITRPGAVQGFVSDYQCFERAVDVLLAQKAVTEVEAASFRYYNKTRLEEELQEVNPNLENAHLLEHPYQGDGITTVKGHLELAGKASNVVFMEKALGVELGKYLKTMRKTLKNPTASDEEKDACLAALAKLRERYINLTQLHLRRIASNLSTHADLHAGNLFYDSPSRLLSVLDLGAIVRPVDPAEHLKARRFLFSVYLSAGTADINFLRLFYQNEKILAMDKIEPLLQLLQSKLNTIRHQSKDQYVIDTDSVTNEMIGIISNAVLTISVLLVPSATIKLSRSSKLVAEELEALRNDLAGSPYANRIPLFKRTQLAVALKETLHNPDSAAHGDIWTPDMWDYFKHSLFSPSQGMSQLRYEKKFIYGILGLSDREAKQADLLVPAAVISAPFVLVLAMKLLYKGAHLTSTKLSQMMHSYQFVHFFREQHKNISESEFFNRFSQFVSTSKFFDKQVLKNYQQRFKDSLDSAKSSLENRLPRFFTTTAKAPFFKRFVPGMIVGVGVAYAAHHLPYNDKIPPKITR
jgi:hypothetical protein